MNLILTDQQTKDFHEQGFVRIDGLFTGAEIDEMEGACGRVYDHARRLVEAGDVGRDGKSSVTDEGGRFTYQPDEEGYSVRHVAWCGNVEPVFDRFGRDPRLLQVTGELLGCDEVAQLINQVHYRKPGSAVAFDWHQDSQHRGIHKGT